MRRLGVVALLVFVVALVAAAGVSARVLRVGRYKGIAGQFTSIQAAIDAARPGDWILVGPGDYHERADHRGNPGPQPAATPGGIVIAKSNIRLRGMDRNRVVLDGTRPGAPTCSSRKADQDFGRVGSGGALGRNGVLIWKADNVWVQNMTACNFLGGSGSAGNEFWWNGGDGSGQVGGYGFLGSYLNATSSYYDNGDPSSAAQYGIFSSNWSGGTWDQTYASNFNDSGYYIGACRQICNQTVNHAHGEFSALGYSGSNSGGQLVVKNSEFDQNKDGFDTNSQNGDNPPPQNGGCPNNGISPITHTHSCWVFMDNFVHDNNNPNVPALGSAAQGPVGTGMSISGGRNDTVMHNRFVNNNAWGFIFVPYPDNGPPCTGGTQSGAACLYDGSGNALVDNVFGHNGSYGNPTNGDIAELTLEPGPSDCFRGNTELGGGPVTSSPSGLQASKPTCGGNVPPNGNLPFMAQVLCDSGAAIGPIDGPTACALGGTYPRRTAVVMHPLPSGLGSMPHPCAGVPANPWCRPHASHPVKKATKKPSRHNPGGRGGDRGHDSRA